MKNPAALFKIKGLWDQFVQNHPKFPQFLSAAMNSGVHEDSIIEIQITQPDEHHIGPAVGVGNVLPVKLFDIHMTRSSRCEHGADPGVGQQLHQNGVGQPSVDDKDLVDAPAYGLHTALEMLIL